MKSEIFINIHAVIPFSRINGPGQRMVVFFQGCERNCPGCFNPSTHPQNTVKLYTPEEIFENYLSSGIDGITVSGGEPFLQIEGLYGLLKAAKKRGLTTVVYTGFRYGELAENGRLKTVFDFTDVLVDGGFDMVMIEPTLLARGSTNQRIYFLSGVYKMADFYMPGKLEVIIGKDGRVVETGFSNIIEHIQ